MIRQNLLMEDGSKYRAIASVCAVVAAISVLGRWQLSGISHRQPEKLPLLVTEGLSKPVETPRLPAPNFLKFETTPMPIEGGLDITDDGSVLTVTTKPDSTARFYRYTPPKGAPLDMPTDDSGVRYALTQNGRLIKFKTTQIPFGFSRRTGARLGIYDLMMNNSWVLSPSRRFLRNRDMIRYEYGENNRTFLRIVRDGKAVRTAFESTEQTGLMELDDAESLWIWESKRNQRTNDYRLFRADPTRVVELGLPRVKATPKLLTSTKGRAILTMNTTDPDQHHISFELRNGRWQPLPPPPGFKSIIIQKVTEDGLMFGALQSHGTNFVPVVWKDGEAYDLRRHPSWPVGGDRSFIQNLNRRGDLIVSTTSADAAETCTLLRRSATK